MLSKKIKRLVLSNLTKYIASDFLSVFVGFIISSYILIYLGAKELGQFTLYMMLAALYSSVAQGSGNSYLMKFFFKQESNQTITSVNITMLIFSLFSVIIYLLTEEVFSSYYMTSYFIVFSVLKAYNSTPYVIMRLYEDANSFFVWSILHKGLYAFPAVYLIFNELFIVDNLLVILFLNESLFFIALYSFVVFKYGYRVSINIEYLKENLKLSFKLVPHKIFKIVYENIDKYAVQFLLGLEGLGVYSMLLRLSSPIIIAIKAVNKELTVIMSKVISKQAEHSKLLTLEKRISILIFIVLVFVYSIGVFYHYYIYDFGDSFYEIWALTMFLTTSKFYYYAFYNENFFKNKKIIYYISFLNVAMIVLLLALFHDSVVVIVKTIVGVTIVSLALLFANIRKQSCLSITKYLYLLYCILFLIILI